MIYKDLIIDDYEQYNNLRYLALDKFGDNFISTNEGETNRKNGFEATINDKFNFIIGAFDNDKLIGIATFVRETKKKISHRGNIYGMFVHPDYQSKGIGYQLLSELLEKAFKIDGVLQINLGVMAENTSAVRLYEKSGFKTYGIEKNAFVSNGRYLDDKLMSLNKSDYKHI